MMKMLTFNENRIFLEYLTPAHPLDTVLEWIKSNLRPEDVFDKSELEEWAIDNGFVLKED